MTDNVEDAISKVWSLSAAIRRAEKYKNDPDFKKAMGDKYGDFVHWLAVTKAMVEQFDDEVQGVTHTYAPDANGCWGCVVASTGAPAAEPLLFDLEGPVGVALGVGVMLLSNRDRPKPVPASAVTMEQKLDWASQQLRDSLPVDLAADFLTNDIVDYRVMIGTAVNAGRRKVAAQQAADHAAEVSRYAKTVAVTQSVAAAQMTVADKLGGALGIDKMIPQVAITGAITTRIRKLFGPSGQPPPQCKALNTDFSNKMGRVNNALARGDFALVKKIWPDALEAAWSLVQCLTAGGSPPAPGAPSGGAAPSP
jgi:hypothetical protein